MRRFHFVGSARSRRTTVAQRLKWLAAFDRSGLSGAAFARKHGLSYTTFCGWRQRLAKSDPSPGFVQVEVTPTPAATELVIELGQGRLHLHSADQIPLAAQLLRHFNAPISC
jgi:hypothetical protein